MRDVPIRQVAIDAGRLLVVPDADEGDYFDLVYRAGMNVRYDRESRGFVSTPLKPDGWSPAEWFRQIVRAAREELGVALKIGPETTWLISADAQASIERETPSLKP